MSKPLSILRAVATAALVGGYAWTCPASAAADPNSGLAGMLSKGYTTSNCSRDQVSGAVAAYKCGQNPLPNGPASGAYLLYGDSTNTAAGFRGSTKVITMAPCASGDEPAADQWYYESSPNTPAGQLACGWDGNVAMVIWTNDQNHMVGIVGGSDVSSLYQWWRTNG